MDQATYQSVLAQVRELAAQNMLQGHESDIVKTIKILIGMGLCPDELIPWKPEDTVVYEMVLKYGRADIVFFHIDGSATVVEVKDGTKGYSHVVAGIGQASLYASQIGAGRGVRTIRKALLWTSTGSRDADVALCEACEAAKTIPLPWQSMQMLMAWPLDGRESKIKLEA